MIRARLRPECRSALTEALAFHAPPALKRLASARLGLPLRPEIAAAGVFFIHVPKAAGTTVSLQLYGSSLGHRAARFYRAADPALWAALPSFALYRDPVSRFASAFVFARAGGTRTVPAAPRARAFAARFEDATACAAHIARIGPAARDRLDPVFRSQGHYLCGDDGALMVDHLFDLAALSGRSFRIAAHRMDLTRRVNAGRAGAPCPGLAWAVAAAYPEDLALAACLTPPPDRT